jgi:hypothetical protein
MKTRCPILPALVLPCLALLAPALALAAPSETCRQLARAYADGTINVNDIATLKTCIQTDMKTSLSHGPLPPASAVIPAMPPRTGGGKPAAPAKIKDQFK